MENSALKQPIVVIGMGELGSVFARGFLRLGYPVQGITRNTSTQSIANNLPSPEAVLIAVGEADIHQAIADCPIEWQDKIILIQNELLPRDWEDSTLIQPTVISVWFEKKKGMDSKILLPSPVFGRHASLVLKALKSLDLKAVQLNSMTELSYELIRKNLYILTTNIAGLVGGGTVQSLKDNHQAVMNEVASEILDIQDYLTEQKNNRTSLMTGLLEAINADPEHKCMGRSAPTRLIRALKFADKANLKVPKLREIAQSLAGFK